MVFDFELVGKIGSMALIRKEDMDIDYNIFFQQNNQQKFVIFYIYSLFEFFEAFFASVFWSNTIFVVSSVQFSKCSVPFIP